MIDPPSTDLENGTEADFSEPGKEFPRGKETNCVNISSIGKSVLV